MTRQQSFDLPDGFRLRPWDPVDAAGLVLAMRDPLVRRYAGALHDEVVQTRLVLQRWTAGWADGRGANWVVSGAGGQVCGGVGYGVLDDALGSGTVGYWLAPPARGRMVAATAVRLTTRVVLATLGWHRIELYHAVENERSCRVARRAGYRLEGVMREAMRYPVDGRWSDEHLHARLATDPDPD